MLSNIGRYSFNGSACFTHFCIEKGGWGEATEFIRLRGTGQDRLTVDSYRDSYRQVDSLPSMLVNPFDSSTFSATLRPH